MITSINMQELRSTADYAFHNGFTCGETIVYTLNKEYDLGLPEQTISFASGFPFGFGNGGNLCGAVAGATIILGALFGRSDLTDPLPNKCLDLTRELNNYIISKNSSVLCPDIISDYSFSTSARKEHCTTLVFHVLDAFAFIVERELNIKVL